MFLRFFWRRLPLSATRRFRSPWWIWSFLGYFEDFLVNFILEHLNADIYTYYYCIVFSQLLVNAGRYAKVISLLHLYTCIFCIFIKLFCVLNEIFENPDQTLLHEMTVSSFRWRHLSYTETISIREGFIKSLELELQRKSSKNLTLSG